MKTMRLVRLWPLSRVWNNKRLPFYLILVLTVILLIVAIVTYLNRLNRINRETLLSGAYHSLDKVDNDIAKLEAANKQLRKYLTNLKGKINSLKEAGGDKDAGLLDNNIINSR